MAAEIRTQATLAPDATYYAIVFDAAMQPWKVVAQAHEAFTDANYSLYVVTMTELGTSSGIYTANRPTGLNAYGEYSYQVRRQTGGSPAITDPTEYNEPNMHGLVGIADQMLMRSMTTCETAAAEHSLGACVLATMESARSGTTWTIKGTDGSTTRFTKTITVDAAANPVTAVT